jgi:hypothetical protein
MRCLIVMRSSHLQSLFKFLLYLVFLFPTLLLFVLSAVYDKEPTLPQMGVAGFLFLFIFLVGG